MIPSKKLHFFSFIVNLSFEPTRSLCRTCFQYGLQAIPKRLRYPPSKLRRAASARRQEARMASVAPWGVAGTFFNPSCILVKLYRPWCKVHSVLSLSRLSIFACHYPKLACSVNSTIISFKLSIYSTMRRCRSRSCLVTALSFRYSTKTHSQRLCVKKETVGVARLDITGSISISPIIKLISGPENCLTVGQVRYWAEQTGLDFS